MLYVALNEARLVDPVVLEIDPNVALIPGTRFSDRNAASSSAVISEDPQVIRFDVIFKPNQFAVPALDRPFFQAEILIPSTVPTSFILTPFQARYLNASTPPDTSNMKKLLKEAEETLEIWELLDVAVRKAHQVNDFEEEMELLQYYPPLPSLPPISRFAPVDTEVIPPLSFCEYNLGPPVSASRCDCVPGLFVCKAHEVVCGGSPFICCVHCRRVLCWTHRSCFCTSTE